MSFAGCSHQHYAARFPSALGRDRQEALQPCDNLHCANFLVSVTTRRVCHPTVQPKSRMTADYSAVVSCFSFAERPLPPHIALFVIIDTAQHGRTTSDFTCADLNLTGECRAVSAGAKECK